MTDGTKGRACLLLHGFTGGPYEVSPLADALVQAGWICRTPELPGHGNAEPPMTQVSSLDWLQAVHEEAEEMQRTYGSFDLVGFSMGGMLAVHLAARYRVRRLALLGAAAIYMSPRHFVREWWVRRRDGDPLVKHKITQTPLRAAWEFTKVIRAVRPDLGKVTVPTLILQGLQDPIVHPWSAAYLVKRIAGETRVEWFQQSKHLLCLGPEADQVFRSVLHFFGEEEHF
ncbi:alpha/beta hydrolase [Gorillibacterium sp. sgz5001074]|uniref:alpha/beta hydrolase n=1 Tax=Gorillibacterium sp. sgz5001074 TaxID=3446695 RepID=UPI003F66F528